MNIKMLLKVFTKNISTETEYGSVEDPLSKHRTGSNETALVSEIPNITNDENVIIAPRQGKDPVSILSDEFCEEQAFLYLLAKRKFGYKAPRDILISPARSFNVDFASDPNYILFARCVYEQHHLLSSIKLDYA